MAINKAMRTVLKALSYGGIEVEAARHLANLKALDPMKLFYKAVDYQIYNKDHQVPIRIYMPHEDALQRQGTEGNTHPVLLFIHGGGWVTESVENYDRVCARMAQDTDHIVVSVDYRLAPEHKFPTGLDDCYAVAKAVYTQRFILHADPKRITLVGDSAGGNLTAALSLMARDRGEFLPRRQILIYPALNNDYSENSPYASVRENGSDYLLTAKKMQDYLGLYQGTPGDRENPYFAPLMEEDYGNQPDTLILTAEYDPLRDEGEEYGRRLAEAGNRVETHRIADALHGYFALGIKYLHVQESFALMKEFLKEV